MTANVLSVVVCALAILTVVCTVWYARYVKRHSRNELDKMAANLRAEMEAWRQEGLAIQKGIREETEQALLKMKEQESMRQAPAPVKQISFHDEIGSLYEKGKSMEEIAALLNRNKGEVQVALSYYTSKKNKQTVNI